MARTMKYLTGTLLGIALLGAVAVPVSGWAVQINSDSPNSTFDKKQFNLNMPSGVNALNSLAMSNGLNLGNMSAADLGKALALSAAQTLMSGNFDPKTFLTNTATMVMVGNIGGFQQPGTNGVGNIGGFGTNGGVGGMFGGGGIEQTLGTALGQVISQALSGGGIQGGSNGGGSNFGAFDVANNTTTGGATREFVQNAETGVFEEVSTASQ